MRNGLLSVVTKLPKVAARSAPSRTGKAGPFKEAEKRIAMGERFAQSPAALGVWKPNEARGGGGGGMHPEAGAGRPASRGLWRPRPPQSTGSRVEGLPER